MTVGGDNAGDNLRSLWTWLVDHDEFRGRVELVQRPPRTGELGSVPEVLAIALGPGGAVTVLGGVLIAWLRQRRSDVKLTVSRDGERSSVELTVKRVANVDAEGVQRQIAELNRLLRAEDGQGDT